MNRRFIRHANLPLEEEEEKVKFVDKLRLYSKHHQYPSQVCYPLAFERSGYLHPTFDDFMDLIAKCASSQPQPYYHIALQLRFAVAFAITFTTATLLRAASLRLLPRSLLPFVPPKPITVPTCWAPFLVSFCTHMFCTKKTPFKEVKQPACIISFDY